MVIARRYAEAIQLHGGASWIAALRSQLSLGDVVIWVRRDPDGRPGHGAGRLTVSQLGLGPVVIMVVCPLPFNA